MEERVERIRRPEGWKKGCEMSPSVPESHYSDHLTAATGACTGAVQDQGSHKSVMEQEGLKGQPPPAKGFWVEEGAPSMFTCVPTGKPARLQWVVQTHDHKQP